MGPVEELGVQRDRTSRDLNDLLEFVPSNANRNFEFWKNFGAGDPT